MPRTATHLRNAEIATIKIMAKHLDMDDVTYRAMLKRETGEVSAADLDWKGRKRVIDHLIALGAPKPPRKGKPGNFDQDVYYAKIEALLADMGASWAYAEAIAERITGGKAGGVKKLAWVTQPKHFRGIVAALEYEKKKRLKPMLDELGVLLQERGLGPAWCEMNARKMDLGHKVKWDESIATIRTLQEMLK